MKKSLLFLALLGIASSAFAQDTASTQTPEQAQARELGMLLGGTATQYDVCADKGFLNKTNPSAEDTVKTYLDSQGVLTQDPSIAAYVKEGWETIKQEITQHESFFTKDKCAGVGKEWGKLLVTMHTQKH